MSGALYLIATPIGNLEDMSLRSLRILREEVDRIACEDTRHSGKLLSHFGIEKPLVSYHEHNEKARGEELAEALRGGEKIALLTDAGTPLISDPGYRLVERAVAAGVAVIPIPGPCAAVTALSASGLATDAFVFGGFLPAKSGARRKVLEAWAGAEATLVFYEAPHRIVDTLRDVEEILGERDVVIGRELTKLHEEFLRGKPGELRDRLSGAAPRGEMTLLIGRGSGARAAEGTLEEAVAAAVKAGMGKMDAIKYVARERGLPKREVYQAVEGGREDG